MGGLAMTVETAAETGKFQCYDCGEWLDEEGRGHRHYCPFNREQEQSDHGTYALIVVAGLIAFVVALWTGSHVGL